MEFIDTKFMTADEKTQVYNALVRFIDSGFKRSKFTKALYSYLSLNFGFIAHYNLDGFWQARFNDPAGRVSTVRAVTEASQWSFVEDSDRTWDLNRAVRTLVSERSEEFLNSALDKRIRQLLAARVEIDRELISYGIDPNQPERATSTVRELPEKAIEIEAVSVKD